jgi:PleD family two-component response regulator
MQLPHKARAEGIVTISLGVAVLGAPGTTTLIDAATLIAAADEALYRAKQSGRDQVQCCSEALAAA